jgi:hypothetical protein
VVVALVKVEESPLVLLRRSFAVDGEDVDARTSSDSLVSATA